MRVWVGRRRACTAGFGAVVLFAGSLAASSCGTERERPAARAPLPMVDSGRGSVPVVAMGSDEPVVRWHRKVATEPNWVNSADGRLVFVDVGLDGRQAVVSLDARTGKERWRHDMDLVVAGRPEPGFENDNTTPFVAVAPVVVVQEEGHQHAVVLDPDDGRLLWKYSSENYPTLSLTDFSTGGACLWDEQTDARDEPTMVCLDGRTGDERWRTTGSRLADDERSVFVQAADELRALDSSGTVRWSAFGVTPDSVRSVDGTVLACEQGVLTAFDDDDGTRLWDVELSTNGNGCWSLVVGRSHAYATTGSDVVTVDLRTGLATTRSTTVELNNYAGGVGVFDERWLVDGQAAVDATTGSTTTADRDAVVVVQTAAGAVRLLQGWSPDGDDAEIDLMDRNGDIAWTMPAGWGDPEMIGDDDQVILSNVGRLGEMWAVGDDGGTATLRDELGEMLTAQRLPENAGVLTLSSVFGIPLGTPMEQAVRDLSALIGPPTGLQSWWNDAVQDGPIVNLVWSTLTLEFEQDDDGVPVLATWSVPRARLGVAWPLEGGVTVQSTVGEYEAAGYAWDADVLQACRAGDTFDLCASMGDEGVDAGPTDPPFWVGLSERYEPEAEG